MPLPFYSKRFQRKPEDATSEALKSLDRPSQGEIFLQVARNARHELSRPALSLAFSGLAGGIFMGLSALGTAIAMVLLAGNPSVSFIAKMFYPLGFIVVILGRAQLFTENTLYPVALVLAERKHIGSTLRLWGIVLPFNVAGALVFASLISLTPALNPQYVSAVAQLGMDAMAMHPWTIFWSGVMGGWIIATVAWLVTGSHSITGSVMIIWAMAFVVGLGGFSHCIAASGEILTAILTHRAPWIAYPEWLLPAVAGNVCGGVGMVTLLEYGQVIADEKTTEMIEKDKAKAEAEAEAAEAEA